MLVFSEMPILQVDAREIHPPARPFVRALLDLKEQCPWKPWCFPFEFPLAEERKWMEFITRVCNFLAAYLVLPREVREMVDEMAEAPMLGMLPEDRVGGCSMRLFRAIAERLHANSVVRADPVLSDREALLRHVVLFNTHPIELGNCCCLLRTTCLMNHSCAPNCFWTAAKLKAGELSTEVRHKQDLTKNIVNQINYAASVCKAIKPIAAGDELTINYVSSDDKPYHQRRLGVWLTRGFLCRCQRCLLEGQEEAAMDDVEATFKAFLSPLEDFL